MKKLLFMLLVSLMTAVSASAAFRLANEQGIYIYYDYQPSLNGVVVTYSDYKDEYYSGDIIIPSMITSTIDYDVVGVGENAFKNCTGLTSVTLPESVRIIDKNAFYSCENLKSINLPNAITTIGESAFAHCTSLPTVTLPESLQLIDGYAFYQCEKITTAILPNKVKSIGEAAYRNCTSLSKVTLSNQLTSIGNDAFSLCESLTSMTFPNSLEEVGDAVFEQCPKLSSFSGKFANADGKFLVVDGVLKAFASANQTTCNIPYGVTELAYRSIAYAEKITSINIPYSVTKIEDMAVMYCSALKEVNIPNSVTVIGSSAFANDVNLTKVTIPGSVTTIGSEAFSGCTSLVSVTVDNDNPDNIDLGYHAFYGVTLSSATLTVPAGCVDLYKNSSSDWSKFGYYATIDPSYTFSQENNDGVRLYYNLVDVSSSNPTAYLTVTRRNANSYNCYSDYVIIPTMVNYAGKIYPVKEIEKGAFQYCDALKSVTIPFTVTNIGTRAFAYCTNLERMTVEQDDPNDIKLGLGETFEGSSVDKATLYVPQGTKEQFKSDDLGYYFNSIAELAFSFGALNDQDAPVYYLITGDDTVAVSHTNYDAYDGNLAIPESLVHGDATYTVTAVGSSAFNGSTGLTSVSLPATVTSIDDSAFNTCSRLSSIDLPAGVTNIGYLAFADCSGLKSVFIPKAIANIGFAAFNGCASLKTVKVANPDPASITMGAMVFSDVPVDKATLYVPQGSKEKYEEAAQWKDFAPNIEEMEFSGIENVAVSDALPADNVYYDLQGRRVANPTSGLYILNGRKVLVK